MHRFKIFDTLATVESVVEVFSYSKENILLLYISAVSPGFVRYAAMWVLWLSCLAWCWWMWWNLSGPVIRSLMICSFLVLNLVCRVTDLDLSVMCHRTTDKGLDSELYGLKDGIMLVLRSVSLLVFLKLTYFGLCPRLLPGSLAGTEFIK